MIDLQAEKLLTFHEARELEGVFPRRRLGKRLDLSTLYRWWKDGIAGVHLEVLSVGSSPATSVQALNRFFAKVAEAKSRRRAMAIERVSQRKQRRAARVQHRESLQRELQACGLAGTNQ